MFRVVRLWSATQDGCYFQVTPGPRIMQLVKHMERNTPHTHMQLCRPTWGPPDDDVIHSCVTFLHCFLSPAPLHGLFIVFIFSIMNELWRSVDILLHDDWQTCLNISHQLKSISKHGLLGVCFLGFHVPLLRHDTFYISVSSIRYKELLL